MVLDEVVRVYGAKFIELAMYDAGACSLANARHVESRGLHWLFCLRDNQPELMAQAKRLLHAKPHSEAVARSVTTDGGDVIERTLWMTTKIAGYNGWAGLKTALRVRCETTDKVTGETTSEDRYYITSEPALRLTSAQWLELLVRRWSVENQNHCTWDKLMHEDKRPWLKSVNGLLAAAVLRRIAYNILSVHRSVTTRAEHKRAIPWTELMQRINNALVRATADMLDGLRPRPTATS